MKDLKVYLRVLKRLSYLKQLDLSGSILLTEEKYDDLIRKTEIIDDPFERNTNYYSSTMSIGLLKYLINSNFNILNRQLSEKDQSEIIVLPIDKRGSFDAALSYPKASFARKVEEAYRQGWLTDKEYEKVLPIVEETKYEKLLESCEDQYLNIKDNGVEHNIPVSTFFKILNLPLEDLEKVLQRETICGMPKEVFIHNMNSFFSINETFKRYQVPRTMLVNHTHINDTIDLSVQRASLRKLPDYASEVEVNEELWNEVISSIPEDFTPLEKAYYIYYELCKTFTYDEEYFAAQGHGNSVIKHSDVSYISNLNSKNNELVCYEFNAIYSKFLECLGAKVEYVGSQDYTTRNHASLRFALGKFLVYADSLNGIVSGDLPRAKMHQSLHGFYLDNYLKSTIQEFNDSIEKVNNYIKEKEAKEEDYLSLIEDYKKSTIQGIELTNEEKRDILLNGVSTCTLPVMDSLTYIVQLTSSLFPKSPTSNCQSYFIRDNYPEESRDLTEGVAVVICFNGKSPIKEELPSNEYYIYRPSQGITKISQEGLNACFDNNQYEELNSHKANIPGIRVK